MAKVAPFLWFVGNMQEAVDFYVSAFKDARIVEMSPMSARFELLGREFLALNAHPTGSRAGDFAEEVVQPALPVAVAGR